ncbi:MAG: response regulator, partial [Saprospiraceae bacterium]|nr:response regulator [Saprospiraceae bacterium]
MKVLIAEDEPRTAIDLANTVKEVEPDAEVVKITDSVEGTLAFLEKGPKLDLAFFDIQLADGLSFEIFKEVEVKCPVVFCTAYDEYALQAFQTNGVGYILKPFDDHAVRQAIGKVKQLGSFFSNDKIVQVAEQVQ